MMHIYVGRWDLLPEEWEAFRGVTEMFPDAIIKEIGREIEEYAKTHEKEDNLMGVYSFTEFEDTFNYDTGHRFNTDTYWLRIL